MLTSVRVRQVMIPEPVTVPPDEPVQGALRLMYEREVGAVLVADQGRLLGIFTERDLVRQAVDAIPGWRNLPISDWMTQDPRTTSPDAGWEETVALMEQLHVRHLPVVEDGRLVGLVTARHLIRRRAEHLDRLVAERTGELQQANDRLLARESEVRRNLTLAGRLQKRLLLPGSPPTWPELGWSIHYAPRDAVGGDYYDFVQPDEDRLGFLIADAAGHSLPAAMVAIMARFAFADVVRHTTRPGEVLAAMNARLQGLSDERFVTAFYGVLDRVSRRFTYANAGHPAPLHCAAGRPACRPLAARGLMLGVLPDATYQENSVRLEPGDRICFYTDGVLDLRDEAGDLFGSGRLERFLVEQRQAPLRSVTQELIEQLNEFRGGRPPGDDVTVLIAEMGR